jgi:hypothetical protein
MHAAGALQITKFVMNSEPHTGARPKVRVCAGLLNTRSFPNCDAARESSSMLLRAHRVDKGKASLIHLERPTQLRNRLVFVLILDLLRTLELVIAP